MDIYKKREDRWTDIYTNRHIERTDGHIYKERGQMDIYI